MAYDLDDCYEIDYSEILAETDLAYLFNVVDNGEMWIPKSQIVEHDRALKSFYIPEWLAVDKGLA